MSERAIPSDARRIVVKVGTHVVTHDGVELALGRLHALVEDLARLQRAGRDLLFVSSGAVGMGRRALGLAEKPRSLGLRQACAAVGQGQLMALYGQAFGQLDVTVAQVLLTQEDLADRDRALCLRTTLLRLLELRALPILNENDSVSVRELMEWRRAEAAAPTEEATAFGDNDGLSARVAAAIDADLLVLLTNVGGLFDANPARVPNARRIPRLDRIDDGVLALAAGSSSGGSGGMTSKLEAARLASEAGAGVFIASGAEPGIVGRLLAGEDLGTWIPPGTRRTARQRHIAVSAESAGALVINAGAITALGERKASLLPVGIVGVVGEFARGDVVEIRDGSGRIHGRGLVNYDAAACRRLAGQRSSEIEQILGYRGYDAVVTRDNLVWGDL